jgi:hypothetical protein
MRRAWRQLVPPTRTDASRCASQVFGLGPKHDDEERKKEEAKKEAEKKAAEEKQEEAPAAKA